MPRDIRPKKKWHRDCIGKLRTCRNCGKKFEYWEAQQECDVCGADRTCGKPCPYGYNRCWRHGGPNPKVKWWGHGRWGIYSPYPHVQLGYERSKMSKHVPDHIDRGPNLAAMYEQAYQDPELLSIRPLLGLAAVRIQQLAARISDSESQNRWRSVLDGWREFRSLVFSEFGKGLDRLESSDDLKDAFWKVYAVMDGAYHDYQSWRDIFDFSRVYRELSESERKRLKEMQQMITAEEAFELVADLQAVITEELADDHPQILTRITNKFARRVGVKDDNWPSGSSGEELTVRPGGMDGARILDPGDEGPYPTGWLSTGLFEGGAEEG